MSGEPMSLPRQLAATRRFTLGAPRNISITPDGGTVHFLRSRGGRDPVLCLWAHDVATSAERLLVDPSTIGDGAALSAAERARRERARESAAGIVRYSVDAAGQRAVMEVGGTIVVAGLVDGTIEVLPAAEGLFDARIDPTGSRCAYVADRSLRVVDLATGEDRVVAADDDPLVSWGRADFIAAEEMGRSRGFWWNPDGTSLLATRVDDAAVQQWFIADPAQPATLPNEIRYPAAGTTNPSVALAEFDLDGGSIPVAWAGGSEEPFEYLADVLWSEGRPPLVVRQTRDQRTVSIAAVDRGNGSVDELSTITDPTWVELIPGSPSWSEHGLLTVEDRADLDRRVLCLDGEPVTGDDVHVRSIVAVDGSSVIMTAWTEPTEIHVVVADLGAPMAPIRQLSAGPGVHTATASSTDAGTIVVIQSNSVEDPTPSVRVTVDGLTRSNIEVHTDQPVLATTPTFATLGKRALRSAILLPSAHDGTTPLPVLLDPYGGPHAQRVLASNASHLASQWFAEQGFAVIVTDNRGAPGRGPAFEREVWGDLASPVLEDQIDALDAAAEQYPFLDLDRVGIRGWSFGGYLAALAVLRRPDRFHAAVAGAPVTDWRLYDTHYTERYLGHPDDHPEHYDSTDLTAAADQLARPLLLIHGLADDNVVAAHTLQLSSALLAAGRPHAVLPLSGVTHMTPQEVVAENLLHLQRDFLHEHLAPGDGGGVGAP